MTTRKAVAAKCRRPILVVAAVVVIFSAPLCTATLSTSAATPKEQASTASAVAAPNPVADIVSASDDSLSTPVYMDYREYNCYSRPNMFTGMKGAIYPRNELSITPDEPPYYYYCHLDPHLKGFKSGQIKSDDIGFTLASNVGGDVFPEVHVKEVEVLNATTARFLYHPTKYSARTIIRCKVKSVRVCERTVFVGELPRKPENFSCLSDNWQTINCTWTEPWNAVQTVYKLGYILPGRKAHFVYCPEYASGGGGHYGIVNRPSASVSSAAARRRSPYLPNGDRLGQCLLTFKTVPQYRQVMEKYQFFMEMNNSLVNEAHYEKFEIDHFAVVRPTAAKQLRLSSPTPRQMVIEFQIPKQLTEFQGVKHRIRYQQENATEWKQVISTLEKDKEDKRSEVLTQLIPYTLYTVTVDLISIKNNFSTVDSKYVSPTVTQSKRTMATVPDAQPSTTSGCFETVDLSNGDGLNGLAGGKRNIFVYWRQINPTQRNGPGFKYRVTRVIDLETRQTLPVEPDSTTAAYAKFERMDRNRGYIVYVTAQNSQGTAQGDSSSVVIPPAAVGGGVVKMSDLEPRSSTKIDYDNQKYEISWLHPVRHRDVTSYTVFWCKSEKGKDRPSQCDGQLDWTIVGRNETMAKISVPSNHIYQLAVSANTYMKASANNPDTLSHSSLSSSSGPDDNNAMDYSSGMVWTSCTIRYDKESGKMKPLTVSDVKAKRLSVYWKLECMDRTRFVTAFHVSYCQVAEDDPDAPCLPDPANMTVVRAPREEDHLQLVNLRPWTFYKMAVAAVSKDELAAVYSHFVVRRTGAYKPESSVSHLRQQLVNASTVELSWQQPERPNGPIVATEVNYWYVDQRGDPLNQKTATAAGNATSLRLTGLAFHADYTFEVRTCVNVTHFKVCGKAKAVIHVKTGVGVSDQMPKPDARFVNISHLQVLWPEADSAAADGGSFHLGGLPLRFDLKLVSKAQDEERVVEVAAAKDIGEQMTFIDLHHIPSGGGGDGGDNWVPDCNNNSVHTNQYNVSIRAVTQDPETKQIFLAPWSEQSPAYNICQVPPLSVGQTIAISAVSSVVVFLLAVYAFKALVWKNKAKAIVKEVDIKLDDMLNVGDRAGGGGGAGKGSAARGAGKSAQTAESHNGGGGGGGAALNSLSTAPTRLAEREASENGSGSQGEWAEMSVRRRGEDGDSGGGGRQCPSLTPTTNRGTPATSVTQLNRPPPQPTPDRNGKLDKEESRGSLKNLLNQNQKQQQLKVQVVQDQQQQQQLKEQQNHYQQQQQHGRIVSGSDSTSGCESGRNYQSDESDNSLDRAGATISSAAAAAANVSSYSQNPGAQTVANATGLSTAAITANSSYLTGGCMPMPPLNGQPTPPVATSFHQSPAAAAAAAGDYVTAGDMMAKVPGGYGGGAGLDRSLGGGASSAAATAASGAGVGLGEQTPPTTPGILPDGYTRAIPNGNSGQVQSSFNAVEIPALYKPPPHSRNPTSTLAFPSSSGIHPTTSRIDGSLNAAATPQNTGFRQSPAATPPVGGVGYISVADASQRGLHPKTTTPLPPVPTNTTPHQSTSHYLKVGELAAPGQRRHHHGQHVSAVESESDEESQDDQEEDCDKTITPLVEHHYRPHNDMTTVHHQAKPALTMSEIERDPSRKKQCAPLMMSPATLELASSKASHDPLGVCGGSGGGAIHIDRKPQHKQGKSGYKVHNVVVTGSPHGSMV